MEQLLVRLGATESDPISWIVYSTSEEEIIASGELSHADDLATLGERAGNRGVIALAPSSEILLKWVTLPPRAGRKVLSALPFMLEDELASDISDQFFAIGPKQGDEQAVAVVSHEKLAMWTQWLNRARFVLRPFNPRCISSAYHRKRLVTADHGRTIIGSPRHI